MKTINVGVIGMGWMGTVHSRSYNSIRDRFYDGGVRPRLVMCADNVAERAEACRDRFGFETSTTNWMDVINHPEIEAVNITSPNFLHREMTLAAIAAGKHVMCEKPIGVLPDDVAAVYRAAQEAGVMTFTGLNYRWVPLVQYAKNLIDSGELGEITNFYGRFFAMYASDPLGMLNWRFLKEQAGTGALGDLMPHAADMAQFLAGPIVRATSTKQTTVTQRPLPVPGRGTHFSKGQAGDPTGEVTNEDYVGALVEFESGARGTIEISRTTFGPKVENRFEIYGTKGAIKWNFETMDEMEIYLPDGSTGHDGFTRILASPDLPFYERFQPGAANNMSYDDLKVIEQYHFLKSIADGVQLEPSFKSAYEFAQVHDMMMRSWESGAWEDVREL
ncbi:MAG: Gfo/Idh/MocA family protein [Candidatus Promineifilaceae bacterium]